MDDCHFSYITKLKKEKRKKKNLATYYLIAINLVKLWVK